jgi:hypothetical protein
MKQLFRYWRVLLLVMVFAVAGAVVGRVALSRPAPQEGELYRTELVMADQYKVQKALNEMAREGWDFIASIPRQDGKVLMIFRQEEEGR